MTIKKNYTKESKAKVELAAIREGKTMFEHSSQYGVHPIQIGVWKKAAITGLSRIFEGKHSPIEKEQKCLIERLYRKVG